MYCKRIDLVNPRVDSPSSSAVTLLSLNLPLQKQYHLQISNTVVPSPISYDPMLHQQSIFTSTLDGQCRERKVLCRENRAKSPWPCQRWTSLAVVCLVGHPH
jgi:hypothetical protein